LTEALRELGYVEGRNLVIEGRYAGGRPESLANLAAELVRLRVDVIVTFTTPATASAKRATATIPIVMTDVGDPVASGLVASLARPGGNVTGLSIASSEIGRKALEVLKEAVPSIARVAVIGTRPIPRMCWAIGRSKRPRGAWALSLDRSMGALQRISTASSPTSSGGILMRFSSCHFTQRSPTC